MDTVSPPMMGTGIRAAREEDLAEILAIEGLCFDNQWREDSFKAAYKDIFFVYEEGKILGFLVACFCDIARKGVILRVAVHPEAQGRGVASQLLERVITTLRERQVVCVELDVEIVKTEVKRLYEKFGFKTLKVVNVDSDYENDAFYMMKLRL